MIMVERIRSSMITEKEIRNFNSLVPQLSSKLGSLTEGKLDTLLSNPNFHLLAVIDKEKDNRIIGLATIFFQDRFFSPAFGHIDDVVLDQEYRGQGLGEKLLQALLEAAVKYANRLGEVITVELTSRPTPERLAARNLYLKHGFEIIAYAAGKGTDLFRKKIEPTA